MSSPEQALVAFFCDSQGDIRRILRSDLNLSTSLTPGQSLLTLVDAESAAKAQRFLGVLARDGAAFGWWLNVGVDGAPLPLFFAGNDTEDGLLVVAARSRKIVVNYCNDKAKHESSRLLDAEAATRIEKDVELYEGLARLNNELVNQKRELAQRVARGEETVPEGGRWNRTVLRMATLTPRERQILNLVVEGKANKVIATELDISVKTVEKHRARTMKKMEAKTFADLVRMVVSSEGR